MRRLTHEQRGQRRELRRALRAWRRFRRQAFEAWAELITAERYRRASLIRPFVDSAEAVVDELLEALDLLKKDRA